MQSLVDQEAHLLIKRQVAVMPPS